MKFFDEAAPGHYLPSSAGTAGVQLQAHTDIALMPSTGAPTAPPPSYTVFYMYPSPPPAYLHWLPQTTTHSVAPLVPFRGGEGHPPANSLPPRSTYRSPPVGMGWANTTVQPTCQQLYPATSAAADVITSSISNHSILPPFAAASLHDQIIQPPKQSDFAVDYSSANRLVVSTSMEVVWHGEFDRLFKKFSHQWRLQPVMAGTVENFNIGDYTVFQDSAKVRFLCKNNSCGNAWTSMKGRVIFWIKPAELREHEQCGIVRFKLFGQKCQKCKPNIFEHPLWYPQEAIKVVYNLYIKVGQLFYGFAPTNYCTERRVGKPRQPHKVELCQACANNICQESVAMANTSRRSSSLTTASSVADSSSSSRDE